MDVEEVADKTPEKIITTRVSLSAKLRDEDLESIVKPYNLSGDQKNQAKKVAQALYDTLVNTDGSLIEINPLILTTEDQIKCLDAKISFDDNALFRHPEIKELRDLNEEDPMEIEASKYELAYIKLDGKIGCMVNGAGLAMATMDIIKLYGSEPANFLDVGGGATKEKVSAAFKIILSDKNVEGILINIFGGIMRCDIIAQGVIEAAKEVDLKVPLVVRLAGTKVDEGKEILKKSGLTIISADNLSDAGQEEQAGQNGGGAGQGIGRAALDPHRSRRQHRCQPPHHPAPIGSPLRILVPAMLRSLVGALLRSHVPALRRPLFSIVAPSRSAVATLLRRHLLRVQLTLQLI